MLMLVVIPSACTELWRNVGIPLSQDSIGMYKVMV